MNEWTLKRFWQNATVEPDGEIFAIRLDGRPVRTPGKSLLLVPTEAIARRIADEWQTQEDAVDPRTMPWTRAANSAIDKVAPQREAVRSHLREYAGTDLLCYRAEAPDGLVARQQATWDPILDWVQTSFGVRLLVTVGVMPITQESTALATLGREMEMMSDFRLTGFYDLVTLSGSFAIALAAARNLSPIEALWDASRIDEIWQAEQWGVDDEAAEAAAIKKAAFLDAASFFHSA